MHVQRTVITALTCLLVAFVVPQVQSYAVGQSKYGQIETFPYQVMLIGKQLWRKRILCGGTLLDKRWILTAGHCTMGVTHFDIYLGAKSVEDAPETGRVMVRSNKFIVHEHFNPVTAANDIALVKLPDDVEFSARIQPAKLPHSLTHDMFTGSKVVATGWGGGEMSNADPMQYTELRVISNEKCSEEYDVITSGIICAQGLQDETVCSGDSGGPLVLKGTQMVVGITSFGPADGCETNIPGGFTRVTYYLDWISEKVGHSSSQQTDPQQFQLPQHQQQLQQQQQAHYQQHVQQQQHQQYVHAPSHHYSQQRQHGDTENSIV